MNPASGPSTHPRPSRDVLLVGSLQPRAGKTALASAITASLAYAGNRVLALRLAGDDASEALADAELYQTLPGARGRGGALVGLAEAQAAAQEQAGAGGLLVIEAPTGADLVMLASELDAGVIVVVRSADAATLKTLGELTSTLGDRLLGSVAMAVPERLHGQALAALTDGPAAVLGVIPEDATLYAPTVLEIADALDAEIVLGEPDTFDLIERLMIGPITTDPGQPYYSRPQSRRAVVTRSDKTDLQLAAMHSDIDCLILTGGVEPSPYTIDRAADAEITVMLTAADTRAAVGLLENIYITTRFGGETKLDAMRALLDRHFDWTPLKTAAQLPA